MAAEIIGVVVTAVLADGPASRFDAEQPHAAAFPLRVDARSAEARSAVAHDDLEVLHAHGLLLADGFQVFRMLQVRKHRSALPVGFGDDVGLFGVDPDYAVTDEVAHVLHARCDGVVLVHAILLSAKTVVSAGKYRMRLVSGALSAFWEWSQNAGLDRRRLGSARAIVSVFGSARNRPPLSRSRRKR